MKKTISPKIRNKLEKIKLIITDVDGVLTGGEIIIPPGFDDIKIWSVKDRLAFAMLKSAGSPFKLAFITGRSSRDVQARAEELGVILRENCADKRAAFQEILSSVKNMSISKDEVACLGDDLIDIPMLKLAAVSVCPSDAHEEVKKICDIVLKTAGGKGAFREFVEILLKSVGLWRRAVAKYMDT